MMNRKSSATKMTALKFKGDIFDAIGIGDNSIVETLLSQYDDPMVELRRTDMQGLTPLRKAVALNKSDICRTLIDYGAEPSVVDRLGKTVLHRAVSVGSRDLMAPLLVSPDSGVNIQDKSGNTPLHYAVKGGHLLAVDWLVFLGANVNIKNNDDKSALDICPSDSPMYRYLKNQEQRDPQLEPIDLCCSFLSRRHFTKLGSDGRVIMATSNNWPKERQFVMCVRKRAAYCEPPFPLAQNDSFFNSAVSYRLMYTLPNGMSRVKVHFPVFEELRENELVLKLSSKKFFLGEVPVEMTTKVIDDYTCYVASADVDLKNQGTFALIKRPKSYQLIKNDLDIYHNPDHEGLQVYLSAPLPIWPPNFDFQRVEFEKQEKNRLMEPLLATWEAKRKALEEGSVTLLGLIESSTNTQDTGENKSNNKPSDSNMRKQTRKLSSLPPDKAGSPFLRPGKIGSLQNPDKIASLLEPSTMDFQSMVSLPHIPVLLNGQEEDDCDDFYYISRGWGLFVEPRRTFNTQMLMDIMEPGEDPDTFIRCSSMIYTLKHSSKKDPETPFVIQIPKNAEYQTVPFVRVGTVLVFVRKALSPDEEELPDPDDVQEETYISEDGKSTKLQFWLAKEKTRWSLLTYGICNLETRVVFKADQFTSYVVVQLKGGTDKWKVEDPFTVESSSEGSGSEDDEGDGSGGGEDDEDGEEGEKKRKRKKTRRASSDAEKADSPKKKSDSRKSSKLSNKSANNISNNRQNHTDRGAELTEEPEAPAPSPQPGSPEFRDRSQNNYCVESDSSESGCENSNNNSRSRSRKDNTNNSAVGKKTKPAISVGNLVVPTEPVTIVEPSVPDLFELLEPEEKTQAHGMPTASYSFYDIDAESNKSIKLDESVILAEPSKENLPEVSDSKRFSRSSVAPISDNSFEFSAPLHEMAMAFDEMDQIQREVAIMWRYRNHLLVTMCMFMRPRPHEDLCWDFVLEVVQVNDLVVRAEMWWHRGFRMLSRSKNFPMKSQRQLVITIHSGLIIVGEDGCPPGGTKVINMWYTSNKVNFKEMIVKKFVEPKMLGGGGGKRKKSMDAAAKKKEPDMTINVEMYYPGLSNIKDLVTMIVMLGPAVQWDEEHKALRALDDILFENIIQFLHSHPLFSDQWWKVWIMLGYHDHEVEREKVHADPENAIKKILLRWFADNLDAKDRGLLRLISTIQWLKFAPDADNISLTTYVINILKEYKISHIQSKRAKVPRYQNILFHWINDTKLTENNILSLTESPIASPTSDIFLLMMSQVVTSVPLDELASAMEVEENFLYMLNEDESIIDPMYKPFRVLVKARQKNEEPLKYLSVLMNMVNKTSKSRHAGELMLTECQRWLDSIYDQKDLHAKMEGLLNSFVPHTHVKMSSVDNIKPPSRRLLTSDDVHHSRSSH